MSRTIIDASVAIKWVVEEDGTPEALVLLEAGFFVCARPSHSGMHKHPYLSIACA